MNINVKFNSKDAIFSCKCDLSTNKCAVLQCCKEKNLQYTASFKKYNICETVRQYKPGERKDAPIVVLLYGLCEHCQNTR